MATETLGIINPRSEWVEQDSVIWWSKTAACIKELAAKYSLSEKHIAGIGVSGQGTGDLPVDKGGEALRNAIIWMDRRSESIARRLSPYRDRVFEVSGNDIDPVYNALEMIWVKENEPEIYKAAHKFLTATEFINFKLTGNFAANDSDGGNEISYDMATRNWSEELSGIYGIPIDKLLEIHECTVVIGGVTRKAAGQTGLPEGTPVVAGGEDTSSTALALGIENVGQSYMSTGTSTNIGVCIDRPTGVSNVMSFPHVIKGFRFLSGNISTTGRCLQWFRDELLGTAAGQGEGKSVYDVMNGEAEQSGIGAGKLLFLTFLAGTFSPVPDTHARGVYCGISLGTRRADMIRALMEGCAFEMRRITDHLKNAGYSVGGLRATGGPAKSDIWNQINCDASGIPIVLIETLSDASVGDAMIAGVGTGVFGDFPEAIAATVKTGKRYATTDGAVKRYHELYSLYLETYAGLKPVFSKLAAL